MKKGRKKYLLARRSSSFCSRNVLQLEQFIVNIQRINVIIVQSSSSVLHSACSGFPRLYPTKGNKRKSHEIHFIFRVSK